jgi:hypothetical protein
MRIYRGIIFGLVILSVFHVQLSFAPPLFTDFSSWQLESPESPTYPFRHTRQCHGDADGFQNGSFWVSTDDNTMLQSVFTMPGGDWPAYYPDSINYDARVDFDRNFIVDDADGDILGEYLFKSVMHIPADCGQKLELHPVTGPLSAGTVYMIEWDWTIYTGYTPLPGDEDNPAGPFELSYSTGDGSGGVIATVIDATSYDWTVPDVNSTNCTLRIEDLSHPGLIHNTAYDLSTFTILPWTGPVIGVEPNDLFFYFDTASPDPTSQMLSIWNAGGEVLDWQITEDCDWLEVIPSSGISSGEPNEVIVSVDTSILQEGGQYQCLLTISDSNAINSPVTIPVYLTADIDCIRMNAPFYDDWVGEGERWHKPECWCYERNCRGDADGIKQGTSSVSTFDLAGFIIAYGKADFKMDQAMICYDFDRQKQGTSRVGTGDLAILIRYYGKSDFKVPVCPMDWDPDDIGPLTGDGIPDYNFWTN